MQNTKTSHIIKRLYGRNMNFELTTLNSLEAYGLPDTRFYLSRYFPFVMMLKNKWMSFVFAISALIMIAGTIFYYNLLVVTEQDVLAAQGRVNTLLQRRNDISINLSKAVFDYSTHERGVFTAIVALRTQIANDKSNKKTIDSFLKKFGGANLPAQSSSVKQSAVISAMIQNANTGMMTGAGGALSPLSRLLAVAEQYPDLKLSATFEKLMSALIDVEKDLATERIQYNETVNIYTTNIVRFPVNFFARLFGFEQLDYFEATEAAQKLVPIDY